MHGHGKEGKPEAGPSSDVHGDDKVGEQQKAEPGPSINFIARIILGCC